MKLLWLDLETTGLDPARHSVLEVAAAVADLSSPLDIGPMLHAVLRVPIETEVTTVMRESPLAQPVEIDPVAREMHERSGLLAECAAASEDLWTFRKRLLDMVLGATVDGEPPIPAGSSIHFDRAFLKVHMPRVDAALSYRNYDARTIQLFCRSLGMPSQPKAGAHRAVADILESIEHVRACMRWLGRGGTHRADMDAVGVPCAGHEGSSLYLGSRSDSVGMATVARQAGLDLVNEFHACAFELKGYDDRWEDEIADYRAESGREYPPVYRMHLTLSAEPLTDTEARKFWEEQAMDPPQDGDK